MMTAAGSTRRCALGRRCQCRHCISAALSGRPRARHGALPCRRRRRRAGRLLTAKLTENFGKSFVIENRGGANGNIGTEAVGKSPKDGYTLLFTGAGFVTNP